MARLILLDGGPLGMIVRAPSKPHIVRCLTWLKTKLATGPTVVIPEIAHYEVRRELLVSDLTDQIDGDVGHPVLLEHRASHLLGPLVDALLAAGSVTRFPSAIRRQTSTRSANSAGGMSDGFSTGAMRWFLRTHSRRFRRSSSLSCLNWPSGPKQDRGNDSGFTSRIFVFMMEPRAGGMDYTIRSNRHVSS